jgi:ketosteroid isomerase-like protein
MNARATVESYFSDLRSGARWAERLAEDLSFSSLISPPKQVAGRDAFLAATQRFYASIASVEVREILADGARVCARTRYLLRRPDGTTFSSDVAEFFTVTDGRIHAFKIYFDTAPFPK